MDRWMDKTYGGLDSQCDGQLGRPTEKETTDFCVTLEDTEIIIELPVITADITSSTGSHNRQTFDRNTGKTQKLTSDR